MKRIILASRSPRRSELLSQLGLDFTVAATDADETVSENLPPEETVLTLARRKALAAAEIYPDCVIIGADTVVYLPESGETLGKPRGEADAERMLRMLSGGRHTVYTGVAVVENGAVFDKYAATDVYMREITDAEIRSYIKTGEPLDKAGAYGIQGLGGIFVERIEGEYFNVTGMPKNLTAELLRAAGIDVIGACIKKSNGRTA